MNFRLVLHKSKYWQCLDDLRSCIGSALVAAGHGYSCYDVWHTTTAPVATGPAIVFGAHRESVRASDFPDYPVVIYQTEVPGSRSFPPSFAEKLKRALCVWDSAPGYGTGQAVVEPGLYQTGAMQTVNDVASAMIGQPVPRKDIDLLFYGSLSPRRIELLTKLQDAGLAPQVHFNVFGAERNALVDRAKVVVDIKQRADDPNDKTRTFFLDSRGACVLTENDTNPRRALQPERIVEQCRELLANQALRGMHAADRRAELKATDVTAGIVALEMALRGDRRNLANGYSRELGAS